MKIRSDAADGWVLARAYGDDECVVCPSCSAQFYEKAEREPIALGGNMVPERIECAVCGEEAENPSVPRGWSEIEGDAPSACDPLNDPSADLCGIPIHHERGCRGVACGELSECDCGLEGGA